MNQDRGCSAKEIGTKKRRSSIGAGSSRYVGPRSSSRTSAEFIRNFTAITLVTMGNPTRQLLNRFMPYLYDWVRDMPDNGLRPLPFPDPNPPVAIPADALPMPEELGVARWINVYRSGDYIGRSLWLDEWYNRTDGRLGNGRFPQPIHLASSGLRTEMCIGAGGHTRYWDDTAPDVAELLNSLI